MSDLITPKINSEWLELLHDEFQKKYFAEIKKFLLLEQERGHAVYPPGRLIFHAFDSSPLSATRVVIIGQDPYHNPGQAHGLAFSVPQGVRPPPSLLNIFKELKSDLGIEPPGQGNLEGWAQQGVLLINSALTVRANQAASHSKIGWSTFTNAAIRKLCEAKKEGLVFMLWGTHARSKRELIVGDHLILEAPHPSPLSARIGFFGCRHFSQCNHYLTARALPPIDWSDFEGRTKSAQ